MARKHNTDRNGGPFSELKKREVWNKGKIIQGVDPAVKRRDHCGATIVWGKYGETIEKGEGWEVDHIMPVSKGGSDDPTNLQPLQWQNNRKKADDYPTYNYCVIKS